MPRLGTESFVEPDRLIQRRGGGLSPRLCARGQSKQRCESPVSPTHDQQRSVSTPASLVWAVSLWKEFYLPFIGTKYGWRYTPRKAKFCSVAERLPCFRTVASLPCCASRCWPSQFLDLACRSMPTERI